MAKVKWTHKAVAHLEAIHEYISQDSKTYATQFIRALIRATDKLKNMPRCGRTVPELDHYEFREVIYQNYRIVYRISEEGHVEVLAALHQARDFKTAFFQEWELL